MSMIYMVRHMPPERDANEPMHVVGIYTTRTLALDVARVLDGDWTVTEFGLNRIDNGTVIWDNRADAGGDCSKFYLRHWPVGFPYA